MPIIQTSVNTRSETYQTNYTAMQGLVQELRQATAQRAHQSVAGCWLSLSGIFRLCSLG